MHVHVAVEPTHSLDMLFSADFESLISYLPQCGGPSVALPIIGQ